MRSRTGAQRTNLRMCTIGRMWSLPVGRKQAAASLRSYIPPVWGGSLDLETEEHGAIAQSSCLQQHAELDRVPILACNRRRSPPGADTCNQACTSLCDYHD